MRLHDSVISFGGLSSHRLCSAAAEPLVHFQRTAQTNVRAVTLRYKKKGFSNGEKGVSPSVLSRSTCFVSQGTKVTLVTEEVF